jgi:hypothetical protein
MHHKFIDFYPEIAENLIMILNHLLFVNFDLKNNNLNIKYLHMQDSLNALINFLKKCKKSQ